MEEHADAVAIAGMVVAILSLAASMPRPVCADAFVGTGTADSCTEAALDAALTGSGTVTFNCGASPVTITVTSQKRIAENTSRVTSILGVDKGVALAMAGTPTPTPATLPTPQACSAVTNWANSVFVSISGNSLTKDGGTGGAWDAGASSVAPPATDGPRSRPRRTAGTTYFLG
ncbi:MAG TPA: hypothetical protein VF515_10295 [Candidatus Binatia bacterium]